ncbi:radical SAM/Cys-rich protein [Desulfobaculum xiamenense]|uniref:Radical SAM/Cys-rich protein n=1 Tax=Desulfobaculum xiamenense TaxID=995050 RepID=A0A846QPU4_9BACT|nr:arsenosugar biosynthesis radical SAM (seleno)protein ArsS [Desulfobaculum xiamenense]NJB67425.1 radical SAM/Cys-rich protein [Desulfobaculum xiamenense]
MTPFARHLDQRLTAQDIEVLQVNMGLRCNLACHTCHLECSPGRREIMGWSVLESVIAAADALRPALVDITGGAPELNPNIKRFIRILRGTHPVQVRTNLMGMTIDGLDDLPDFFALHKVRLVASLPCSLDEAAVREHGNGLYRSSIDVLKRLNQLGYGHDEALGLDIVFNHPLGPYHQPGQRALAEACKRELDERFGITVNRLFTITNVPLNRYLELLRVHDMEDEYMQLAESSFNATNLPGLMCRHQVNVGWDGTLYDCDFNQALGLPTNHGAPCHISQFDAELLRGRSIVTGPHCFACTAGIGSACSRALS